MDYSCGFSELVATEIYYDLTKASKIHKAWLTASHGLHATKDHYSLVMLYNNNDTGYICLVIIQ